MLHVGVECPDLRTLFRGSRRLRWYFVRINAESLTREAAHRYLDAWTGGDRAGLRRLLADDVQVESNLDNGTDAGSGTDAAAGSPERVVEALGRFADHLDAVRLVTETHAAGRAVLMYDCLVGNRIDPVRVVDFLEIGDDGVIHRIRRVYDVVGLRRSLPDFAA